MPLDSNTPSTFQSSDYDLLLQNGLGYNLITEQSQITYDTGLIHNLHYDLSHFVDNRGPLQYPPIKRSNIAPPLPATSISSSSDHTVSDPAVKEIHKQVERERRSKIKMGVNLLASLIPAANSSSSNPLAPNKAKVIEDASAYIVYLKKIAKTESEARVRALSE